MSRWNARCRFLGVLLAVSGPPLSAFHEGGVASCGGCHVMHDSAEGAIVATGAGGAALLVAESPSDACLACHAAEHGAVLGDSLLAPPPEKGGGNFVFLREENLNDAAGGVTEPIPGDAAGHNVVAPGHGLAADSRDSTSPGGTFPAGELGCTSCHDPHGNQNFRFLYGAGPVQGGLATFTYPAPLAEGIDLETGVESDTHHTAYHRGVSDWCGNCHGRFHAQGAAVVDPLAEPFDHPSDEPLGSQKADRYNRYNGDDDATGGTIATAYLAAVPFEGPASSTGSRSGAAVGSRVMCLTCHRAHASSSPFSGRWDLRVDLLAEDGVISGSWPIPSPYPGLGQGPLCAKCHEAPAGAAQRGSAAGSPAAGRAPS